MHQRELFCLPPSFLVVSFRNVGSQCQIVHSGCLNLRPSGKLVFIRRPLSIFRIAIDGSRWRLVLRSIRESSPPLRLQFADDPVRGLSRLSEISFFRSDSRRIIVPGQLKMPKFDSEELIKIDQQYALPVPSANAPPGEGFPSEPAEKTLLALISRPFVDGDAQCVPALPWPSSPCTSKHSHALFYKDSSISQNRTRT